METLILVFIVVVVCSLFALAGYSFAGWEFERMARKNHERLLRDLEKTSFNYLHGRDGD